jgi:hypothetical protein
MVGIGLLVLAGGLWAGAAEPGREVVVKVQGLT